MLQTLVGIGKGLQMHHLVLLFPVGIPIFYVASTQILQKYSLNRDTF